MAHLLVYIQRTAYGIHPASAVACCIAREIASTRGAALSCFYKDGPDCNHSLIAAQIDHYGGDIVECVDDSDWDQRIQQLEPLAMLAPHTSEGQTFLNKAANSQNQDITTLWQQNSSEIPSLTRFTSVVAGTFPWVHLSTLRKAAEQESTSVVQPSAHFNKIFYYSHNELSKNAQTYVETLAATAISPDDFASESHATLLYFADHSSLQTANFQCSPLSQIVLVLESETTQVSTHFLHADWVLQTPSFEVLENICTKMWPPSLHP